MTGIAVVVYLNQPPYQPRERDYVYAGAFYAFSIWLGLGVLAIGEIFEGIALKFAKPSPRVLRCAACVAVLFSASVPVGLATENWDDHDRSGRYMARDIGYNYLNTVPKNAIIINFGDNDTFPIWYCQEVEGIRPDVRVMNTSYLGGEWYIDEMKLAANEAKGIPFTIPSTKYSFVNDWVLVIDPVEVLDTQQARRLRGEKRRIDNSSYYDIRYTDSEGKQRRINGNYATLYRKLLNAQETIDKYDPYLQQFMESSRAHRGDLQHILAVQCCLRCYRCHCCRPKLHQRLRYSGGVLDTQ